MTIDQFRRTPELSLQWQKLMGESSILQIVLAVMEENHPARMAIRRDNDNDLSPTMATLELGLTRGYSKYGDSLRLLGNPIAPVENIGPPTYSEPKQRKETKQNG